MSTVSIDVTESYSKSVNALLDAIGNDADILTRINEIIGQAVNQFVPMDSGDLRESMRADEEGIHWGEGLEYAHYQYEGIIYRPNKAVWRNGNIVGWISPAGAGSKYPTGEKLGRNPGVLQGWVFGYTTPSTIDHWDMWFIANQWNVGGGGIKLDTNLKIYREVVRPECKKRGL